MRLRLLAVSLLVFAACSSTAHRPLEPTDEAIDATAQYGLSGTLTVLRAGRVSFDRSYGFADRAASRPITSATHFDIGSLSKQFTAAAVLALRDEGRLAITDPVARFLSDVPADKSTITIHQLLTHTAGIDYDGNEDEPMERDEAVCRILGSPLSATPGAQWAYSNGGYNLLAAVIERASGESYEEVLATRLFARAGLGHTGFTRAGDLAHGYSNGADRGTPLSQPGWRDGRPSWNLIGAGGLLSTRNDLEAWIRALSSGRVLTARSREELFTPHTAVTRNPFGWTSYGYGWFIGESGGRSVVIHDGSNGIFFASVHLDPARGDALILLANAQDEGNFANENLLRTFSARVFSADLPPAGDRPCVATIPASSAVRAGAYTFVTPATQAEIDAVLCSDAAEREHAARLGHRVASVLAAAADGDPLAAKMRAPLDRAKSSKRLGEFLSAEVVGTVPVWWSPEGGRCTFVRMRFTGGEQSFRVQWSADDELVLAGLTRLPPLRLAYREAANGMLVTEHPVLRGLAAVRIASTPQP